MTYNRIDCACTSNAIVEPGTLGSVEMYISIPQQLFESILKNGIKSKEGQNLKPSTSDIGLHHGCIFLRPCVKGKYPSSKEKSLIFLSVDPNKIMVGNQEMRGTSSQASSYNNSVLRYEDYLLHQDISQKNKKTLASSESGILLHEDKVNQETRRYIPEVPIYIGKGSITNTMFTKVITPNGRNLSGTELYQYSKESEVQNNNLYNKIKEKITSPRSMTNRIINRNISR